MIREASGDDYADDFLRLQQSVIFLRLLRLTGDVHEHGDGASQDLSVT